MLVLQRRRDEEIVIGRDGAIRVRVLGVTPQGHVALGFTAPPSVPVHRREVFEAIRAEGERKRDLTGG